MFNLLGSMTVKVDSWSIYGRKRTPSNKLPLKMEMLPHIFLENLCLPCSHRAICKTVCVWGGGGVTEITFQLWELYKILG